MFFICLANDDFSVFGCCLNAVSMVDLHNNTYVLCSFALYIIYYRYIHCMCIQLDFSAFCVLV